MNTELPAPEDYYRLTRARGLREEAREIELLREGKLWHMPAWLAVSQAGFIALSILAICLGLPWVGILLIWSALALCGIRSMRCPVHLRAEADRLEAEHQARHGALTAEEAD
jgi:hypothetical protein